ncbi:MAG: DUF1579 domain-containing protein [Acidobacteriota bacterium]
MKTHISRMLVFTFVVLVAAGAIADDKKSAKTPPQMDEKAMMEAWMKAATPGEAHKKLEPFVGSWNVQVKNWMAPGAPADETSGTSENEWALGGRYVQEHFNGTFMQQPYEGIGFVGYDNIKKTYVSTWMDNMSTAMMMTTGSAGENGKMMNFKGTMDDPMSGKAMKFEEKLTVTDNDHHMMEMWSPAPDGKMYKSMEITYSRKQ